MIVKIYFSEYYSVDESTGYYYQYITVEGIRIVSSSNLLYHEYSESFNLSCCVVFRWLDPDIDLESVYNVIGNWLNTEEAANSFFISTLRIMYFKSIFSND